MGYLNKTYDHIATESYDQSVRIDDSQSPTSYFGFAKTGADESALAWKIKRVSVANGITKVEYADGNNEYDNAWADRYSLIYS